METVAATKGALDREASNMMISKMERLMGDLRKTPIFRQLIPMEAQIGWPIPFRRNNKVYVTFIVFGISFQGNGKTALFPPFAKITLDWSNQIPVEYVNLRFQNPSAELPWKDQIGVFPHLAIAQITVGEYQEKRHTLLTLYDEMLAKLAQNSSFNPEWKKQFSQLLQILMEPDLEPYYRLLNPNFFNHFLPRQ